MKLAVFCSGSFGNEILDLIQNDDIEGSFDEIIFIDDIREEDSFRGIKVYSYDLFKKIYDVSETRIVIASGEPRFRRIIRDKITSDGYSLCENLISKKAYIGKDCAIGKGCVVFPYVYISNRTAIGDNSIIHSGAHVESETTIGSDCFLSLGSFVGANGDIMDEVFVGPNSSVLDHTKMEKSSILGMGGTLLQDAKAYGVYVGCPAKYMRKNTGRIYK